MELIKQWFLSLCAATAITGIFNVFLSNTNFKKTVNVFLTIFVLFYTVIPLSNIQSSDISSNIEDVEQSQLTEENYEQVIVTAIKNICDNKNIEVLSVDIESYMDDDCLVVEKILVETDTPDKSKNIEELLKNELGFEVNVN